MSFIICVARVCPEVGLYCPHTVFHSIISVNIIVTWPLPNPILFDSFCLEAFALVLLLVRFVLFSYMHENMDYIFFNLLYSPSPQTQEVKPILKMQ